MEKGKKNEELFCGMPVPAYHLFCKSHDDYDIFCADRVSGHRKKRQPIILSVLRKGTVDVPFMLLFNHIFGIRGVAWATPVAEIISLLVAAVMVVPYIRKLARGQEI